MTRADASRRRAAVLPRGVRFLAAVIAFALAGGDSALALHPPVRAPRLRAHGYTLTWNAVGRGHVYKLLIEAGGKPKVRAVAKLSVRPKPVPGHVIRYRVRVSEPGSTWSNRVAIRYSASAGSTPGGAPGSGAPGSPVGSTVGAPQRPVGATSPPGMIVGVDAGGWGASAFSDIADATHYVRLESKFATDAEVGGAADAGVSVAAWLFGTGPSISAIDPATYAAEIVSVFERYGKGGTFWRGREDLGSEAVEVLNEPGNATFWRDPTDYSAYALLLQTVHDALVANFASNVRPKLLASWDGGEGPSGGFGLGWAALGGLAYIDGVTVHPYGGSSGQNGGALGGRAGVEEAHALSGKPVYITEIGWPTDVGASATGDSQQWSEAQQAQNIKSFVTWAKERSYIQMVVIFNYVDYGSNDYYGIERKDRTHKLSYTAISKA